MATLEERIHALEQEHRTLEQEHTELKKTIELQTIAIGALVNKAALEKLNEKYDNIFKALENHDRFINVQLAELREKVEVDIEGKIVGMQTEMRQNFTQTEARFTKIETTQQEHTTRLGRMEEMLAQILARLPEKP
jgi:hypothetical protein